MGKRKSHYGCGRLPERSTPSMPAAYDLSHSKYTVQKITKEWKKKNYNNNTGEKMSDEDMLLLESHLRMICRYTNRQLFTGRVSFPSSNQQ